MTMQVVEQLNERLTYVGWCDACFRTTRHTEGVCHECAIGFPRPAFVPPAGAPVDRR
jgi:hypothetical protein